MTSQFQVQTRARGVTQTYSAHSFKDFTLKPGEDVSGISGDSWLRASSGFAVLGGMEGDEEVGCGGRALERNQFDRRSQLRRSKKQRKKSSMSSSPPSPCKTISASVDSSSLSENNEDDQKKSSPVKSETLFSTSPRTASGIVRAEMRSEKLTQILLNSSRTEYNSNYGNLI